MPIPSFDIKDKKVLRLVELSAKLSYRDKKYTEWINEIGIDLEILSSSFDVSEDVSEIDAIVSLLYGLSLNQVEHIYENFHRGWNYAERLDKVKNFYEKWCK
jgi:vacuolar-type H+-ATPase subunit I/STV1